MPALWEQRYLSFLLEGPHWATSPGPLQCLKAGWYLASAPPAAQTLLRDMLGLMQSSFASPQMFSVHVLTLRCASGLLVLCDLTPYCLCLVRFDYCRFIELDYVPMETGYMVSMRPTKGYASTKSPTKGYASTKSPDRHSRSTNSPSSTPRSRSVLPPIFSW